jgi:hypothetical protein
MAALRPYHNDSKVIHFWVLESVLMQVHLTELPPTLPENQSHQNGHIFASH